MYFLKNKFGILLFTVLVCASSIAQETLNKELKGNLGLDKEPLDSIMLKAGNLVRSKKYEEAKEKYDRAFKIIKKSNEVEGIKQKAFRIEMFFRNYLGAYDRSKNVLGFLKEHCTAIDDQTCIIRVHIKFGLLHTRVGEYIKALEYYNEALSLAKNENNLEELWRAYISRGVLFLDIGDEDQSKKDFKKGLSYIPDDDPKNRKANAYLNLSASFRETQPDSVIYYSRLAAVDCKSDIVTRECIMVYNNIAMAYCLKKMPNKSLEVIRDNIPLDDEEAIFNNGDDLYPGLMHTMGAIQYELKNYKKALEYFLISQTDFEQKKDISDLIKVKGDLSKTYEKLGNFSASINALREIQSLESLQLKIKISKELAKNESKSLLLAKEKVISGLEEKNLKIEKQVNKTKWLSYLLGVMLFFTLLVLIYRGYKSRIRYYQINEQLTLTRLSSLRSSMNPHFLFNTFSTLQNYILKNDNLRANEYMTELSGLIRNVLNSSDSVYIDFVIELDIIQSYTNLQRGRFQEEFDVRFIVDPVLIKLNPRIPSMMIQPFIENAIIHGFSHSTSKGELKIVLEKNNNTVVCSVLDNGIGREASEKLKKKGKDSVNLSIATENTNERLGILNEIVTGRSNVIINDLIDDVGNPKGTEVIITLPIIKEIKK